MFSNNPLSSFLVALKFNTGVFVYFFPPHTRRFHIFLNQFLLKTRRLQLISFSCHPLYSQHHAIMKYIIQFRHFCIIYIQTNIFFCMYFSISNNNNTHTNIISHYRVSFSSYIVFFLYKNEYNCLSNVQWDFYNINNINALIFTVKGNMILAAVFKDTFSAIIVQFCFSV